MLNKVRVGNIDNDDEKLLKTRFIHESDENYPKDALHMYSEKIEAADKIPDNFKYPKNTLGSAKFLK